MKYTVAILGVAALAATAMFLENVPIREKASSNHGTDGLQVPGKHRSAVGKRPDAMVDPGETASAGEAQLPGRTRAREDRSCTLTRHYLDQGDGTVTEAYSCVGPGSASHAYDHYDDATLELLAYSDAEAATVLGKRLVGAQLEKARTLILRALALEPRNAEPAMWLASQAYSLRGDSAAAREAIANQYVITRVARELGALVAIQWIVDDLRRAGFDDVALAALDARAAEDLHRIENIQLEVFGRRNTREDLP